MTTRLPSLTRVLTLPFPTPHLTHQHPQFLDEKSADRVLKLAHEQQYEEEAAAGVRALNSQQRARP
jgi:hypothetical protein